MTQLHIQHQQRPLRVAHQSEILALRKEVAELKHMMASMQMMDVKPLNKTLDAGKMKVPAADGFTFVKIDDIIYGEAQGNYCTLYVQGTNRVMSYLISKTLKTICASLPESTFFRCHQSYVINTTTIQSYSYSKGMQLHLTSNACIPVSRRNKKYALDILQSL